MAVRDSLAAMLFRVRDLPSSRLAGALAVLALWTLAAPAQPLDDAAPKAATPLSRKGDSPKPATLDELYARLAHAQDEAEAQGLALRIERILGRSSSDVANLLMSRAGTALERDQALLAEDLIDRILDLEPDWAEAWMRRAALRMRRDDVSGAVEDFAQALKREPRHLDALNGLGFLLLRLERRDEALRVLERALALDPFLEPARKVVAKLAAERAGQAL